MRVYGQIEDAGTHPQLVSNRLSPTWSDAIPKSAIRMLFFSSSSRFSGFKSLWLHQRRSDVRTARPQDAVRGEYGVSEQLEPKRAKKMSSGMSEPTRWSDCGRNPTRK